MRHYILSARAVVTFIFGINGVSTGSAEASQSCRVGYYFNTERLECVKKVKVKIKGQDNAARGGPQWGPVSPSNCAQASREMDRSAALCRSYDARKGAYDVDLGRIVDGKLLKECAKCCRQLREGMNRWAACYSARLAPRPNYAAARRSSEAMNCPEAY